MIEKAVRTRRDAIRAEYMDEEAEAAEAEALENSQAVLSVRVPTALAEMLKMRAAEQHVPTSALIRRILTRRRTGGYVTSSHRGAGGRDSTTRRASRPSD
jgi:predicted DNA binding CopG/RHH family protein